MTRKPLDLDGKARHRPARRKRAAEQLDHMRLDGLIVIGGDGSLRGAWEIAQQARTPVVGMPKMIDNDVGGTEYTPRLRHRRQHNGGRRRGWVD